ncbi:dipeptidase [Rhodococcus sp. ABRD24]|uniref:dipeptidase n=1 Tax=Rhodococcus sp. ABRD24 TaxID=2507582 RepID=UPI0010408483|nr:membrane dipeptidase [Rhodococcus sp. ABRD24]QBJ96722.1 dipeptidase [Rhodococcus sp. ABRD24]
MLIDALQFSKPERARFVEWREGNVTAVHVTIAIWEDSTETMRELGKWQRRLEENADLIVQARTVEDIAAAERENKTAVILGFQNSSPFESDLDLVSAFYEAGVRIAQLTYNTQNSAGAGCWEDDEAGLSKTYGLNLIREMNRIGMLIDLSHCNEKTSYQAIEASDCPVAITHANPVDCVGMDAELAVRNKSKDLLKALAQRNGVVGLSMYPRIAPNGVNCSIDDFCDMVFWTVENIGIDHVGFGSDFYIGYADEEVLWWRQGRWSRTSMIPLTGYTPFPRWFDSSRGYTDLLARLEQRGMSPAEVSAVAGGNWARVFSAAWK